MTITSLKEDVEGNNMEDLVFRNVILIAIIVLVIGVFVAGYNSGRLRLCQGQGKVLVVNPSPARCMTQAEIDEYNARVIAERELAESLRPGLNLNEELIRVD